MASQVRGNRLKLPLRLAVVVVAVVFLLVELVRSVAHYIGQTEAAAVAAALSAWIAFALIRHFKSRTDFETLVKNAAQASDVEQHSEALAFSTKALDLATARKYNLSQGLAVAFLVQSKAQQHFDKKVEALNSAARAFACLSTIEDFELQLMILDHLGWMLLDQRLEQRAIPILEAASLVATRSGATPLEQSTRLERAGMAYARVGLHANAMSAFGKSIDLMVQEKGSDSPDLAGRYTNLGNAYRRSEKPQDAERCYREALRLTENPESVSVNTLNLGVICAETGRNEEAERFYLEALRIRKATLGCNHWRVGNVYNNLAGCRRRARDFEGAERYLEQAKSLLEDQPASLANVYDTLSRIREEQGRDEEALREAAHAREVQQKMSSPDLSELATLFDREASLAARTGDNDRAFDCRSRASQIRVALASAPPATRDLTNMGDSLKTLEQHLEASLQYIKFATSA